MGMKLADILGMSPVLQVRREEGLGLPTPAEARALQQRLAGHIGRAGMYPLSLTTKQALGVPLTPYYLPKLMAAQRLAPRRAELAARAGAPPDFLEALVKVEPALGSWKQGLQRVEAAARQGAILLLGKMSQGTDALTARIEDRLERGGGAADRLRVRLSRVLQAQAQFSAVAQGRRDRLRRQREAAAEALEAARAQGRLLRGVDRLALAGVPAATALRLPGAPAGGVTPTAPTTPRAPRPRGPLGPLGDGAADALPGGPSVTPEELTGLALEAAALVEGFQMPAASEEEIEGMVLSIDPLVLIEANLYSMLLPAAPGPEVAPELEGLYTGDLPQQAALLWELLDLHEEADRGLRGARDAHLVVASVGQQAVARLLKEVHAIVDRPPTAETEMLRSDAGELLRLEEEERQDRLTAADRTRKEKAEQARALGSVERQNRFLKTVQSMRNRDAVSRQELEEALSVYDEIGDEQAEARRTRR